MDFKKIDQFYKKVSYHHKPDNFSLEEWQYALRKQFADMRYFKIENRGKHTVFSDFDVYNPDTKRTYKVAIRSKDNSANFCECNDFKTNRLGTCKHIEAVLKYIHTEIGKGHLLEMGYTPSYSSIYIDYRGTRTIKIRIGSDFETEFKNLASEYFDNLILNEDKFEAIDEIVAKARAINPRFRCYPDALEYIIEVREAKRRGAIVKQKYLANIQNGVFDKLANASFFPYQKEGVCFAADKGRCIIADDMGLGKTLQAISAAELLRHEMGISTVFIICPTSLKYQWKTEIEKFTGQSAWVIEGHFLKRRDQYQNGYFYKIISYNTAVNDIEEINASSPDLFILDEAQRIKNFKTKISQNIKKLKSPYTFVLTGTPLENKLEELYSIVQFVNPFILGPFFRFMHDHRITDENGKVTGYRDLNSIGELLSDTMIRRRKKDVLLQLPERMDKVLYVPMTDEQRAIHSEYQDCVAKLISKWRRQGFLNEKDRQSLMIFLNMMRMVCDSTFIIDQKSRHDTKIGELMSILEEVFAEGDEKVVVFSQWERMTRIVAEELDARGIKYEHLHGGVPSANRGKLFESFTNDPNSKVFLSTDAGGVGLNLQAASLLINLDIPWNPAVLEQRIARIYRLGQKRNVSIINMVSTDTIEHKMLGVLSFKKGLADGILDQGDNTIFMEESKFKVLMNTVEEIVNTDTAQEPQHWEEEEELVNKAAPQAESETPLAPHQQHELPFKPVLPGDDDIEPQITVEEKPPQPAENPVDLVQMGFSFFGKLAQTLSDPVETQKLVSSLVQKDEKDGKAYLKIPVENEKVVENVLSLFAGIIGGMKK
jgi:SNF2 family DNA or RNA helicase